MSGQAGERHEGGGHRSSGDKHNGKASTDVLISLRTLQSGLLATVDCAAYSQEMGLIAAAGAGRWYLEAYSSAP